MCENARKRFNEKVVLITGAASGIGAVTAEAFAREGAKVAINDYSKAGQTLSDNLNAQGYDTIFIQGDAAKEADTERMVAETVKKYGRLNVAFANAGIGDMTPSHELSLEQWQRMIDINLTGVFLTDKYAIRQMLAQPEGGAIVNCGSIHSHVSRAGIPSYSAAKGGVKMLTQSNAITYAGNNIRVNCVCPGYIATPLLSGIDDEGQKYLVSLHPMGRLGRPDEVANAVLFLSSSEASFITGASLLVDGGYTSQ